MKTKPVIQFAAALLILIFSAQLSPCAAQGSLTPPGAPAPAMKSLSQIEARTPVDALNTPGNVSFEFYINQPGSYYLTGNITGISGKNGIGIAANNVTVDLNGFTLALTGAPGLLSGVFAYNNLTNIIVRNGTVTGWNRGLNSFANYCIFENLVVSANLYGIQCAGSAEVRNCTIIGNNSFGVEVDGSDSLVVGNHFVGNNAANSPGLAAIYVTGSNNHVENNHVTGSGVLGYGISVASSSTITNNIIVKNLVEGGGANNYSISGNNDVGPIGSASTNMSPWANISR